MFTIKISQILWLLFKVWNKDKKEASTKFSNLMKDLIEKLFIPQLLFF